ncbi:TetR/AcrR family transcriptional regulator [Microbacterium sp. PMB16]|uniref:TetR/AcrR family transcriptional regulator n=1 Tax=Microbacterium sp. PMB16 TaxID=3120157 RepID=UPI003F4C6D16
MGKRGLYAKGRAKREEILATALDLISRNGYTGVSIREISEECGLTPTAALHYFESKEELFVEVLRRREASNADAGRSAPDPLIGIRTVISYNSTVPGLVRLYTTMAAESGDPGHPAQEYFQQHFQRFRTALAASIEKRNQARPPEQSLDAERLARVVMALSDGLQIQWLGDPTVDMAGDMAYAMNLLGLVSEGEAGQ